MKITTVISLLSLSTFALAKDSSTTTSQTITDASSYLAGFGITSGISGAQATSLASALLSLKEQQTTQSAYISAWSVIQTAVPTGVWNSLESSGFRYQLDSSTTVEPSWYSSLPDSVKKELVAEESQLQSVEEKYLATTTSSGMAAQQTLAAGGVLAAGILGVAALL
ncbi:uncharacterized protein BHQ10_007457 [Talaromyces amestolkiae]|uniref:Uncharacterized protein n=1 Tax=Talaromyces amestolkiae TaxID=1196081 RepID=A0A364L6K1_TALAM|nr:uncharacterized protein BHQ10_007457 [Talaromyces amestolkiae]RAO71445.1 hypothetical protein BHQ10_007457 [Talaromyces amestolkiae]